MLTPKTTILISSALFALSASTTVWLLLDILTRIKPAEKRITGELPILFKAFLPLTRFVIPHIRGKQNFERILASADSLLVQGGRDRDLSAEEYTALRFAYLIIFSVIGLTFITTGFQPFVMFGLLLILFGAFYPPMWLRSEIRTRHRAIQRGLPNILDLMTLSVEAGRDFLTALRDILQQREGNDPLKEELERVFREIQLGKQRRQALRNLADRVKHADLTMVVETLAQADELGVSIGQILRILGDQMRQKRFQHAEKLANESPVKLLLPLFLFIFPAVIIIMLGPILLRSFALFSG